MVAWANRLSTILVVDDDESSRLVLRSVLEPSGHLVLEAPDGQTALDMISSLITPDIVVTDLEMPVLSGEAFISNAVIHDTFLLRACIVNFRTSLRILKYWRILLFASADRSMLY